MVQAKLLFMAGTTLFQLQYLILAWPFADIFWTIFDYARRICLDYGKFL